MPVLTLSEALAQIDLLRRRSEQKQRFIEAHLLREERLRDVLAADGGTEAVLHRELESLARLRERHVLLRRLIQQAYAGASLTIGDVTRSVADWLAWKREVVTRRRMFLKQLLEEIRSTRATVRVPVVVHLDEQQLASEAEKLEQVAGQFEGQLQLKNATLTITVPADDWVTGLEERLEQLAGQARPVRFSTLPPPWDLAELRQLALDPLRKIHAIKRYRELTGIGLAEAKQAVEAFARGELSAARR